MMKHILYILTVVFCLGITACQRHSAYPLAIQQAEALMDTRPDSALLLLESMADSLVSCAALETTQGEAAVPLPEGIELLVAVTVCAAITASIAAISVAMVDVRS